MGDMNTVAVRLQECSSRVKELEAWQETLLSMTAAKDIPSNQDSSSSSEDVDKNAGPLLLRSALDVFDWKKALIGCLVLTNMVLLVYVCLCRSSVAAKKQYAKVH